MKTENKGLDRWIDEFVQEGRGVWEKAEVRVDSDMERWAEAELPDIRYMRYVHSKIEVMDSLGPDLRALWDECGRDEGERRLNEELDKRMEAREEAGPAGGSGQVRGGKKRSRR